MGRAVFLHILTLIAGICLGVMGAFTLVNFDSPTQSVMNAVSTPATPDASSSMFSSNIILPSESDSAAATPTLRSAEEDDRLLLTTALDVLAALKERDHQALSSFIDPANGVIFTPYSTVDLNANLCFTAAQVAAFKTDTTKYVKV